MWETIRGYLTFTRKERYGVLFLFLLISIFFVLPYFFKPSPGDRDPAAFKKIEEDIRKFESRVSDSSHEAYNHGSYRHEKILSARDIHMKTEMNSETVLFYFDPNKIPASDWLRLGLSDRLAHTIRHYIEKGGRFQKAEDLKKLYGLHSSDYDRLFPYVRIDRSPVNSETSSRYEKKTTDHISLVRKSDSVFHENNPYPILRSGRITKKFVLIDINLADSNDWSKMPGIGDKLTSRIIRFREKLGGFYQVDQVAETFGLPDTTFQKIKPYLQIRSVSLNQIDINTATKEILIAHPYIRWQLAKGIIEYRTQHGSFQSVDDLLQLAQMDPAKFEKLKPYLTVHHE
jgi:competence protein ComEA